VIPTLQLGGLGRARAQSQASIPTWEEVITDLAPLYWMKLNEANTAAVEASGNFGSAGGTVDVIEDSGFPTFGEASLIPSEPTRSTCENGAGGARIIMYGGGGAARPNAAATIYFIYAGTTGNSTQIAWRDGAGSGNWFARFDGTNVILRIRGVGLTTTYANSNIKDGNAHLIGVCVTSTDASLWVDGVEVWTGSCGGSTSAANGWTYTQNGNFSNQKLYGLFGDFLVWNRTLTDTENEDLYAAYLGVAP
jgi:hypothetical protein